MVCTRRFNAYLPGSMSTCLGKPALDITAQCCAEHFMMHTCQVPNMLFVWTSWVTILAGQVKNKEQGDAE